MRVYCCIAAMLLAVACISSVVGAQEVGEDYIAYNKALDLERRNDLAGAEKAYESILGTHKSGSVALMTMRQLAGIKAMLGKSDAAFELLLQFTLSDIGAAGTQVRENELPAIKANCHLDVARACLSVRGDSRPLLGVLRQARSECDKALAENANARLTSEIQRRAADIDARIQHEEACSAARNEISTTISAFAAAVTNKDADGIVALLSPSANAQAARQRLEKVFQDATFTAPNYRIEALRIRFNDSITEATLDAELLTAQPMEVARKPKFKAFKFIRTATGWKMAEL